MSALDSIQINKILSTNVVTRETYIGTFAYDRIPNIYGKNFSLIINLDKYGLPGSHWVALIGFEDKLHIFDTYSRTTSDLDEDVRVILNKKVVKMRKVIANPFFVQNPFSELCGHYCIYVLILFGMGVSFSNILKTFSENLIKNDEMVLRFIKNFV